MFDLHLKLAGQEGKHLRITSQLTLEVSAKRTGCHWGEARRSGKAEGMSHATAARRRLNK